MTGRWRLLPLSCTGSAAGGGGCGQRGSRLRVVDGVYRRERARPPRVGRPAIGATDPRRGAHGSAGRGHRVRHRGWPAIDTPGQGTRPRRIPPLPNPSGQRRNRRPGCRLPRTARFWPRPARGSARAAQLAGPRPAGYAAAQVGRGPGVAVGRRLGVPGQDPLDRGREVRGRCRCWLCRAPSG